ncbi:NEP1-interacting protein 1 [Hibiscus syriacus]|uniref:NEP1-interacting protein 1 n=1 Tax=Hibiscus syriacus TaxID=106335 RepID=A0A6A3D2F3_HIBSY|nr:NEP1-interacting protein 1 [Hibiscus syriacus]
MTMLFSFLQLGVGISQTGLQGPMAWPGLAYLIKSGNPVRGCRFLRGDAAEVISGAIFSIEVFESSIVLWQSDESRIGCLLYLMGAAETAFEEVQNIFDTDDVKGLKGDLVEKIPKIIITQNNIVDAPGIKFPVQFAFRSKSSHTNQGNSIALMSLFSISAEAYTGEQMLKTVCLF